MGIADIIRGSRCFCTQGWIIDKKGAATRKEVSSVAAPKATTSCNYADMLSALLAVLAYTAPDDPKSVTPRKAGVNPPRLP